MTIGKNYFLSSIMFLAIQVIPQSASPAPPIPQAKQQLPAETADVFTNSDVVLLFKSGLTAEIIIAKINSSKCRFDTSTVRLQELRALGLPDAVIVAMINAPDGQPGLPTSPGNSSALPGVQSTQTQTQPTRPPVSKIVMQHGHGNRFPGKGILELSDHGITWTEQQGTDFGPGGPLSMNGVAWHSISKHSFSAACGEIRDAELEFPKYLRNYQNVVSHVNVIAMRVPRGREDDPQLVDL